MIYNVDLILGGEKQSLVLKGDGVKGTLASMNLVIDGEPIDNIIYYNISPLTCINKKDVLLNIEVDKEASIKEYVENNMTDDELIQLVDMLDSYSGMDGLAAYDMDDIDEILYGKKPSEIVLLMFYGNGFNPINDYFRFDGCGNLESFDKEDYIKEIKDCMDDVVSTLMDTGCRDFTDELNEILDI